MKRMVSFCIGMLVLLGLFIGCDTQGSKKNDITSVTMISNSTIPSDTKNISTKSVNTTTKNQETTTKEKTTTQDNRQTTSTQPPGEVTATAETRKISSKAVDQRKTRQQTVPPKATTKKQMKPTVVNQTKKNTKKTTKKTTVTTTKPYDMSKWVEYAKKKAIENGYELNPVCTDTWDAPILCSAARPQQNIAKDIDDSYAFYKKTEPDLVAFWIWYDEEYPGVYNLYMGRG